MKTNSKDVASRGRGAISPRSPAKARTAKGGGFLAGLTGAFVADPTRAIAASLLVTAFVSVSVNALFLQTMKHPAPLFDNTDATPAPAAKSLPENVPVPIARSTAFSNALTQIDESAPDTGSFTPPQPPETAAKSDSIGDLISGANPKAQSAPAPNKTVLAAQRALNKLGYPVRADGVNGGTTRQAVERFERDNRLPVKGDLSPKLLRELSIAAGMPVE